MNSQNETWRSLKTDYLRQVEKALSLVNHPRTKDVLADVSSHLDQRFAELSADHRNWENFQAIITDMGPPCEYAELLDIGQPLKKQRPSLKFVVLAAVVLGIVAAAILFLPKYLREHVDPNIIVPGLRVGLYKFDMSKDDVLESIRESKGAPLKKLRDSIFETDGLVLCIVEDSLKGMTVLSPRYKFANGLGVGDSEQKVKEAFGHDFDLREFKFKNILTYKNQGLSFEIRNDNKTVMEINVSPKIAHEPSSSKIQQPDPDAFKIQRREDTLPHPFLTDPEILGYWESVDFVFIVSDFKPGTKKWPKELFLKNIKFMKNGRTSLPALNWSKDWIYDRNTTKKAQYQIKVIGGEPYLFFPWLAPSRGKPPYYVLQKASSVKPLSSGTHNAANDKAVEVAITVPRQCDQNDVVSKEVSANSDPEPITDGLTELQRKRLPIRGRELKLLKKLADVATAWVSKSEQSSKVEVDRLIGLLLAQPNPSVDVYFASAKIANLCGQPDKAISILEDVVAKHGRDDAPGFAEPIDLVAYHWIGRIARHSGNTAKAISAYETILQNAKNLEGINQIGHVVSCKLYLAEMALENIKDKDLVVKRLDEIIQIIESIDIKMKEQWSLFLGWAKYQRSVITDGKIRARQQLVGGDSRERGMACMTAASQLSITGVAAEGSSGLRTTNRQDREILPAASIRRVAQGGRSRLDTSLVRLFVGRVEEMEKSTEAEKYYSALFEEDSFFSPMGGIGLARCEKQRGKIDEANELLEQVRLRYPGYGPAVQKLKESWEEKP